MISFFLAEKCLVATTDFGNEPKCFLCCSQNPVKSSFTFLPEITFQTHTQLTFTCTHIHTVRQHMLPSDAHFHDLPLPFLYVP
jgi:hypothetical protein